MTAAPPNFTAQTANSVQAAEPLEHRVTVNGVSLAYFEWHPELRAKQPSLLFAHATGFHARVWDQLIALLPARHVIALEQRGHGRSETTPIEGWQQFGRDAAEFAVALDLQGAYGIGHSMGAHALVQAAAFEPKRFARLVLLDPVILAPQHYHLPPAYPNNDHPAALRMNRFESAQAMFTRFEHRAPYSVLDPKVLRDYCNYALRPANDVDSNGAGKGGDDADAKGFVLACAPETEAKIYMTARENLSIYASIRALNIPVLLVRAKLPGPNRTAPDFSSSPTWPELIGEFRHGREIHLSERTHLLALESPSQMADILRSELGLS